ncbi:SGNH/GDSL hydrolase family protein [Epibacterium sp. SM1979]|uniref:SGNH/GDSL hydrolase family protein n=1 Tax=Tritonibacter litoralis TaxID=2662264 RepID=A0A843YFR8_9RHOB|nr:SGNH/GDSL hydrolase family protein [Tritonibacter litoralis]MQQ08678.1 SGNH/GDSL hydrolase family protein [Tritonibacter litoralis]
MARLLSTLLAMMLSLMACADTPAQAPEARILVIGDSMMTWHGISDRAVPDLLARQLGEPVINRATTAARMIYKLPVSGAAGLNIPKQFRAGPWEWIVVNGGGNDLWLGCGCHRCTRKLDRLVSEDGQTGAIPDLLTRLRATGAQVIYVGYLRTPGRSSPIESCRDEGTMMEERVAEFAGNDPGLHFISLVDLVPEGDLSFHTLDRIHPSVKGSRAIAARLAATIQANR